MAQLVAAAAVHNLTLSILLLLLPLLMHCCCYTGGVLSSTGAAAVLVQTFMPALLMQGGRQDVPPRTRDRCVPLTIIHNFVLYYYIILLESDITAVRAVQTMCGQ
jgi:hypothetical protein